MIDFNFTVGMLKLRAILKDQAWVQHTLQVKGVIGDVLTTMTEGETAYRG